MVGCSIVHGWKRHQCMLSSLWLACRPCSVVMRMARRILGCTRTVDCICGSHARAGTSISFTFHFTCLNIVSCASRLLNAAQLGLGQLHPMEHRNLRDSP